MSEISSDDVMWFLGICRLEAIESLLSTVVPDFETKYAEVYKAKIIEAAAKNPQFQALLKEMGVQQKQTEE